MILPATKDTPAYRYYIQKPCLWARFCVPIIEVHLYCLTKIGGRLSRSKPDAGLSSPAPGPIRQSSPAPGPTSLSSPAPGPTGESYSAPGPISQSTPAPGPISQSSPAPGPISQSFPAPRPTSLSSPAPGPTSLSSPAPGPTGESYSAPGPISQSSPAPGPTSQSSPAPGPISQSYPAPGPTSLSYPAPGPISQSYPAPGPISQSSPAPGPIRQSSPAPGPTSLSSPAPGPISQSFPAPGPISQSYPAPSQSYSAPGPISQSSPAPGPTSLSYPAPGPIGLSSPAPGPIRYCDTIKMSFRAYDAWKRYNNKFEFYFRNNGSEVSLCKTNDPESCIVVELKVETDRKCFVLMRECEWDPPEGQQRTSRYNWNIATAIYACHSYASKYINDRRESPTYTNRSNFATGLVQAMVERGPSNLAIQVPDPDIEHFILWGAQLGVNIHICGSLDAGDRFIAT